jgi:hypothetical protein
MSCINCKPKQVVLFKTSNDNLELKKNLQNWNFEFIETQFLNSGDDGVDYNLDVFSCKICNEKWYLPEPQDVWNGCFLKKIYWKIYWYGLKVFFGLVLILFIGFIGNLLYLQFV